MPKRDTRRGRPLDEWDRGRWCDICHQKHYQISPACERRRRQREYEESEEGKRAWEQMTAQLKARVAGLGGKES